MDSDNVVDSAAPRQLNRRDFLLTLSGSMIALAAGSLLDGCGGGGGAGQPNSVTDSIGPTGGTVSLGDAASLQIPAGALAAATAISIAGQGAGGLPAFPQGLVLAGSNVFNLTPDGTTFNQPVTLTLAFDAANVAANSAGSVSIYTLVGAAWQQAAGSSVNVAAQTVSANIGHFSTWAALGPAPAASSSSSRSSSSNSSSSSSSSSSSPSGSSSSSSSSGSSGGPAPALTEQYLQGNWVLTSVVSGDPPSTITISGLNITTSNTDFQNDIYAFASETGNPPYDSIMVAEPTGTGTADLLGTWGVTVNDANDMTINWGFHWSGAQYARS